MIEDEKVFCIRRKVYKKVVKTFARECKLLMKGRKDVHVGMKSYTRVEKFYFDETFFK